MIFLIPFMEIVKCCEHYVPHHSNEWFTLKRSGWFNFSLIVHRFCLEYYNSTFNLRYIRLTATFALSIDNRLLKCSHSPFNGNAVNKDYVIEENLQSFTTLHKSLHYFVYCYKFITGNTIIYIINTRDKARRRMMAAPMTIFELLLLYGPLLVPYN